MLSKHIKAACTILFLSTANLSLTACDSSGGMRVAGIGEQPATPVDDGSGAPGSGSGAGGGSNTGSGSGSAGGSAGGGSASVGGSGSGSAGGVGSIGGGASGSGVTGTTSGLLASLPVPGVVGANGVGDTGVLANTGNPSNPGAVGTVLVAAGNAALGANAQTPTLVKAVDAAIPGSVPIAGTVSRVIGATGQALVDTGNGKTYLVDGLTASAGQAVALNVVGKNITAPGASPLVGTSVLSNGQNGGGLATVGVDSAGNLVKAVATPLGTDNAPIVTASATGSTAGLTNGAGRLVGANAGTTTLLGTNGATPLVGASVLSPTQTTGSLASVGAGSAGNTASVTAGPLAGASGGGTVASPSTGVLGGVSTANGLVGVTAGNNTVLNGGASPLVSANALSGGNALSTTIGNGTTPLTNTTNTTTSGNGVVAGLTPGH